MLEKLRWHHAVLAALVLAAITTVIVIIARGSPPPRRSGRLEARLELAAGDVTVDQGAGAMRAASGAALIEGTRLSAGAGARALLRLSDGSALFLRAGTVVELQPEATVLERGELWVEVPSGERTTGVLRLGDVSVTAAESGLSMRRDSGEARVYVARGLAHLTSPGGRAEVRAGELAVAQAGAAPRVTPVSYWEDWTGGMADQRIALGSTGAGRIYGVDTGAAAGSPARPLEVARQAVRAVVRSGLAETEVDQTFFNPGERDLEGWYWLTVPEGALVTGFAVESDGALVEGEMIERKEAVRQYGNAAAAGFEPALLEWIDGRSYRARIFPVAAGGTRRIVTRYLQTLPLADGRLRYHFPLRSDPPVRIGELSLAVDLGRAGREMTLTTLEDARIEDGGEKVTMRRSGYLPNADFLLEARPARPPAPIRAARFEAGPESADFLMLRYVPDLAFATAKQSPGAVVVIVDTSAGIDDTTRQLEVAAAEAVLRALSDQDRFALMTLDVRPQVLHPATGLAAATDAEVAKARERLAAHTPGGATDLGALFDVALQRLHGAEQPAVIYIGDGIATSGEIRAERLQAILRRSLATSAARLYTLAVGGEANADLLDALARAGGGRGLRIGSADEAGSRALELVAALKTPTVTDFELDAGAGLDEVFTSAAGKVSWGGELVLLARSHHDLPATVKVRGRLGGERFERTYKVEQEAREIGALVPRLWAAANVQKLLGDSAAPDEQRGSIVNLGVTYGLMTPFTSFLALDSEGAYAAQGIPRRQHPGNARLVTTEARVATAAKRELPREAPSDVEMPESAAARQAARTAAEAKAAPAPVPAAAAPARRAKAQAWDDPFDEAGGAVEEPRAPKDLERSRAPSGLGGLGTTRGEAMKKPKGGPVRAITRPAGGAMAVLSSACSDASQRPTWERALLWEKRLRAAENPTDLIERYRAAIGACELPDWQAEALFLRLLARRLTNEGAVNAAFEFLAGRPDARLYLARVLLRSSAGESLALAIEKLVFGGRVAWDKVDLQLQAIADPGSRVARLREYVALSPDDPAGGVRMVQMLTRAGRKDEALVFSRKLRQAGLVTPRLALAVGDLLAASGQADDAIRIYSEVVEYDPANLSARQLLGDVFLAHGWYDLAYGQYRTLTEIVPDNLLWWLRLASAAAGAGRSDEALRLERKVARAPGSPGPSDPRSFARLASAARLARMLAVAGADDQARRMREAMSRDLAELQLFQGPGTMVVLTWSDLSLDLVLAPRSGKPGETAGDLVDGAAAGVSSWLGAGAAEPALRIHLRSAPASRPVKLGVQLIRYDGKSYQTSVKELELGAGQTDIVL